MSSVILTDSLIIEGVSRLSVVAISLFARVVMISVYTLWRWHVWNKQARFKWYIYQAPSKFLVWISRIFSCWMEPYSISLKWPCSIPAWAHFLAGLGTLFFTDFELLNDFHLLGAILEDNDRVVVLTVVMLLQAKKFNTRSQLFWANTSKTLPWPIQPTVMYDERNLQTTCAKNLANRANKLCTVLPRAIDPLGCGKTLSLLGPCVHLGKKRVIQRNNQGALFPSKSATGKNSNG